ncbi:hypothetical protein [Flavobacterium agrisoli]|uniref:Uncharacterized protein n=1 Tax=Flavobacterium agrisoli TaxID=2793066 RepID=A0A934UJU7_9FLAO|nr:hypothetical protein [Flavobacterium agrisoli]MBK0369888.1 hypothetical protein [Flavobacterium agrisoli]
MSTTIATVKFSNFEKQYIKRVQYLMALVDELKKSRYRLITASQLHNSELYFELAKNRIVSIIQLQNQINKYSKPILEAAYKLNFEQEDLDAEEFQNKEFTIINALDETQLIDLYQKAITELPLPSHLELLLCQQLVSIEQSILALQD